MPKVYRDPSWKTCEHDSENPTVIVERQQRRDLSSGLAESGIDIAARVHNVMVDLDHLGLLGNPQAVNRAMGRELGAGLRSSYMVFIRATIRDYREKRKHLKSTHPLRKRRPDQISSIPAIGPLAKLMGGEQIVKTPRIIRDKKGPGYYLSFIQRTSRDHVLSKDRLARVKHKSRIEEIGLALVPGQLVMSVESGGKQKTFTYPEAMVTNPMFFAELFRQCIAPRANTVALDLSMKSQLSPAMFDFSIELRRGLRRQQAASAIAFRVVSPVGRELQETLAVAKSMKVIKPSTMKRFRSQIDLKCPECDGWVSLKLNPTTGVPLVDQIGCTCCSRILSVGRLLATRASSEAQDAFSTYKCSTRSTISARLAAAPKATNKGRRRTKTTTSD